MRGPHAGASIPEVLVALILGALLLAGMVSAVRGASQAIAEQTRRSESAEVLRTVWSVLDEELSVGRPGLDWILEGEHALLLRAFRGIARVCGPADDPGVWAVAWRGQRAPDAGRDSLLALRQDGAWIAADLVEARAGGNCVLEEGERAGRWRPDGSAASSPGEPILFRFFEWGRYSLEDGAFRYRRGAGGRQPLTPERLGPGSRFLDAPEGPGVRLELEPGGTVEWRLPPAGDAPVSGGTSDPEGSA